MPHTRSPASPVEDHEPLSGLVERVTYHNADNGYCVLRVKARGNKDLVTVVGHTPLITPGEYVQASGRWVRWTRNLRQVAMRGSCSYK